MIQIGFSPFSFTFSDGGITQFWPNACTKESSGTSHHCNRKHLDSPSKTVIEAADSHCRWFKLDFKLKPLGIFISSQLLFFLWTAYFFVLSFKGNFRSKTLSGSTNAQVTGWLKTFVFFSNKWLFFWQHLKLLGGPSQARRQSLKSKILKDKTPPSSDHSTVDTFRSPLSKNESVWASAQVGCPKEVYNASRSGASSEALKVCKLSLVKVTLHGVSPAQTY